MVKDRAGKVSAEMDACVLRQVVQAPEVVVLKKIDVWPEDQSLLLMNRGCSPLGLGHA